MHSNAVSFVTHLVNDFDEIEAFRAANEEKTNLNVTHPGAFAQPHYCLNPAVCFPCYESFEGKRMKTAGQTLTWVGRVFRYESGNIKGLDRLWEFSVRELVFLGDDSYVRQGREAAVDLVQRLAIEWDLDCSIETATDPFFATVRAARTFWQKARDVKSEIRLQIEADPQGKDRTIAAGSTTCTAHFSASGSISGAATTSPRTLPAWDSDSSAGCSHFSPSMGSIPGAGRSRCVTKYSLATDQTLNVVLLKENQ